MSGDVWQHVCIAFSLLEAQNLDILDTGAWLVMDNRFSAISQDCGLEDVNAGGCTCVYVCVLCVCVCVCVCEVLCCSVCVGDVWVMCG